MKAIFYVTIFTLALLFSCEKTASATSPDYYGDGEVVVESTESYESPLSSSLASYQDSVRKFKKTGELKFQVQNVYQSTKNIETKISKLKGFVTKSHLNTSVLDSKIIPINRDSANKVRKTMVNAEIRCKVPQHRLAEFLLSLESEIEFLNYRNLDAEELTFDFELSKLQTKNNDEITQKIDTSLKKGGKLPDEVNAINELKQLKSEKSYSSVAKSKLIDEVKMSEILLYIYENEKVTQSTIPNVEVYNDYRESFMYSMKENISLGYYMFLDFLLLLSHLWLFIIIGISLYFGIKYYKSSKKIK